MMTTSIESLIHILSCLNHWYMIMLSISLQQCEERLHWYQTNSEALEIQNNPLQMDKNKTQKKGKRKSLKKKCESHKPWLVTILFLSLFILVDLLSPTTEFTCLKWDLDHWGLHEHWHWRSCSEIESALSLEHERCIFPFVLLPYPWNFVHCLPLLKQQPWCCSSWHPLCLMLKEKNYVLAWP